MWFVFSYAQYNVITRYNFEGNNFLSVICSLTYIAPPINNSLTCLWHTDAAIINIIITFTFIVNFIEHKILTAIHFTENSSNFENFLQNFQRKWVSCCNDTFHLLLTCFKPNTSHVTKHVIQYPKNDQNT